MQAGVWPGVCSAARVDGPQGEAFAVVEEMVELAAVALELRAGIEDLAEHVLDHGDARADGQLPPSCSLT